MNNELVIDLFAGPGGWDEGLRQAGFTGEIHGIDFDKDACATARAAGHDREQADLAEFDPLERFSQYRPVGIVASPTCRPFARAGNGSGFLDPRAALSHVPLRWVKALRPRWCAFEQVPSVLGLWEANAVELEELGYSTWTGIVRAEQYGVPQTRRRAVLLARLDGLVARPTPTAARPVSMGEALGWRGAVMLSNYGTGGDPKRRGQRTMDKPAFTMTGKCGRNKWVCPGVVRNVTVEEAGVLQGFRRDYPWRGGATARQQQVGDAVPPPLAAALVAPLLEAVA